MADLESFMLFVMKKKRDDQYTIKNSWRNFFNLDSNKQNRQYLELLLSNLDESRGGLEFFNDLINYKLRSTLHRFEGIGKRLPPKK